MDFMVSLAPSKGFDAIMVVVDRFSKMAHFIPTKDSATAQEMGRLFFTHVFTTRNFVICNHTLCNWDATACRMQLFLQLCPLFGCVCNYGATMIAFIPTFG
jgi:hypothetical protein